MLEVKLQVPVYLLFPKEEMSKLGNPGREREGLVSSDRAALDKAWLVM